MASLFKDLWRTEFGGLREQIDAFVDRQLENYLSELEDNLPSQPKTIHDPLWGNIVFSPAEMLIVDSPLLQRLRHIKQLGLASLLYPGALHTRFEHTLGVAGLASKVTLRMLSRCGASDPVAKYCDSSDSKLDAVALVRIAALFHDTGHFFLSHAGEKALTSVRLQCHAGINAILHDLKDIFPKEPHLGELLSALVATAPATQNLLSHVYCALSNNFGGRAASKHTEAIAELAACFILGVAPNSPLTPYASILSGTLDADKCDYLRRDSIYSGVPVAVDIDRIVEKLTCIAMPLESRSTFRFFTAPPPKANGECFCDSLAIEEAAVRNIDDMLISRALMYEKVYYHHKVLTAETTFIEGLHHLELWCPDFFKDVGKLLELTDGDFICLSNLSGIKAFVEKYGFRTENAAHYETAARIFLSLTLRQLHKRCCILSENTLSSVPSIGQGVDQENVRTFLQDVVTLPVSASALDDFISELTRKTRIVAETLGIRNWEKKLDGCGIIVAPYIGNNISEVTFTVASAGKGKKYNQIFNIESWQDGRLKQITQHLLLAPGPLRLAAHLAAELVLYEKYRILLPPDAHLACKIDGREYIEGKKALASKGVYQNIPALMDVSSHLSYKELQAIHKIAEDFSRYQPHISSDDEKAKDPLVSAQQILTFIAQFTPFKPEGLEYGQFFRTIVAVLEKVRLVTPSTMVTMIGKLYKQVKEEAVDLAQYPVFPLGNFKDSASHLAYYFEKELKRNSGFSGIKSMDTLGEHLRKNTNADALVFYDDAFYSGKQAASIFKTLLGETPDYNNPHVDPLASDDLIAMLREKQIYLLYGYGNGSGKNIVEKNLENLGLRAKVFQAELFPPKIFSEQLEEDVKYAMEPVREVFAEIGRQLLQPLVATQDTWNEERVRKSGLGYDNAEQGIVYTWNTPTYTLTALWRAGQVRVLQSAYDWFALFPRDEKRT